MKTITARVPLIKQSRKRDYVFLLEDLELTMHKDQLQRVTEKWNEGSKVEVIAKEEERNPVEILLALMHQAKTGFKMRPFAGMIPDG